MIIINGVSGWTSSAGYGLITLLFWLGSGCALHEKAAQPAQVAAPAILEPIGDGPTATLSRAWLVELFPKAQWFSPTTTPWEALSGIEPGQVLLIPNCSELPMSWWTPIKEHMERGRPVLFWGRHPLAGRVRQEADRFQRAADFEDELIRRARPADPFSNVQTWLFKDNQGAAQGSIRLAAPHEAPWPAVWVDAEHLDEWAVLCVSNRPARWVSAGENSLAFHAAAGPSTTRLMMECEERDGARWGAVLEVGPDWRPFLIHPARLRFLGGNSRRGGRGDRFNLSRLVRLSIGLSAEAGSSPRGPHSFGLSDVRLAADPRSPEEAVGWPDIPPVSPPHRYYETRASIVEELGGGKRYRLGAVTLQSPRPLPAGWSERDDGRALRWVPLFAGTEPREGVVGHPASLYLAGEPGRPLRRSGWIGVDPAPAARPALEAMLIGALRRLGDNRFLLFGGATRAVYPARSDLQVVAQWQGAPGKASHTRVAAELRRIEDAALIRRVILPARAPGRPLFINLGAAPPSVEAPGHGARGAADFLVRVTLEDTQGNGQTLDSIEHLIKVMPPLPAEESRRVTAAGGRFMYQQMPLLVLGVRYEPESSAVAPDPSHWLDREEFCPTRVRRDFQRLRQNGFNTVYLSCQDERQAQAVQWALHEAAAHDLFVILSVPSLNPLAADLGPALRLLRAAEIDRAPTLMALEMGLPCALSRAARRRLEDDWSAWTEDQFGSIEAAEAALGHALWKQDGSLTGPPEALFFEDGPHRAAVELYRCFLDDHISRRTGWIRNELAALGVRCLLTASFPAGYSCGGDASALAVDPAACAVHLDFVTLDGSALSADPAPWETAAFDVAYARGVTDGQPVLWRGGLYDVGRNPGDADLAHQRVAVLNLFDLLLKTRGAGCVVESYPGGWRPDRRADTGLAHPDGRWRPAALAARAFPSRHRRERALPAAWKGREIDRGGDAQGLCGLRELWQPIYGRDVAAGRFEELRWAGFGQPVAAGSAPLLRTSMNAEWGRLEVDGRPLSRRPNERVRLRPRQTLRAEIVNTGPASWSSARDTRPAGGVRALVTTPRGGLETMPVAPLRFKDREWIAWTPLDAGQASLRLQAVETFHFGEVLKIEVREPDP